MIKITFVEESLVKPVLAWFLLAAGDTIESPTINIYS